MRQCETKSSKQNCKANQMCPSTDIPKQKPPTAHFAKVIRKQTDSSHSNGGRFSFPLHRFFWYGPNIILTDSDTVPPPGQVRLEESGGEKGGLALCLCVWSFCLSGLSGLVWPAWSGLVWLVVFRPSVCMHVRMVCLCMYNEYQHRCSTEFR